RGDQTFIPSDQRWTADHRRRRNLDRRGSVGKDYGRSNVGPDLYGTGLRGTRIGEGDCEGAAAKPQESWPGGTQGSSGNCPALVHQHDSIEAAGNTGESSVEFAGAGVGGGDVGAEGLPDGVGKIGFVLDAINETGAGAPVQGKVCP